MEHFSKSFDIGRIKDFAAIEKTARKLDS